MVESRDSFDVSDIPLFDDVEGADLGSNNKAFGNLTHQDLYSVLCGDSNLGLVGYYNYQKSVHISEDLGIDYSPAMNKSQSMIEPKEFLKKFEQKYKDHVEDKQIVLHSDSNGYLFLPYSFRGSDVYRSDLIDKIDRLGNWVEDNNLNMVHIRLSPRTYSDMSPLESLMKLRNIKNNLLSAMRNKLGNMEYLMTLEPNKKGHAHVHMLIFTKKDYLIDKSWLDQYWSDHGLGSSAGVWINKVKSRGSSESPSSSAVNYATKYITKTHNNDYWSGLIRLTRTRSYTASSSVVSAMNRSTSIIDYDFLESKDLSSLAVGRLTQTDSWSYVGTYRTWIEDFMGEFPESDPPPPDLVVETAADLRWGENMDHEQIESGYVA